MTNLFTISLYFFSVIGLFFSVSVQAQWSQETMIPVLKPLQSSNSVLLNDCGLRLTNPSLLEKIHGQIPQLSLSANDIITAYNLTVSHPDCGGKSAVIFPTQSSTFITNLCALFVAKLEGNAEKIFSRPSLAIAKELEKTLVSYGTNPDGVMSGIVALQLKKSMGVVRTQGSFTSPEKCGTIDLSNNQGLLALYRNGPDAIRNIATDCGSSIPYTPLWMTKRLSMLNSSSQTPYVFGLQQGGSYISTSMKQCRDLLNISQQGLFQKAQNISIQGGANYNATMTDIYLNTSLADQDATQNERLTKSVNLIQNTAIETKTQKQCVQS